MTIKEAIEVLDELGGCCSSDPEYTACNMAIAALSAHRWIPVTERLPEQSGAYLVILYTVPDVARLYYYYAPNEEFGQTRSGVWCAETVTHWMPLPEPPEELLGVEG